MNNNIFKFYFIIILTFALSFPAINSFGQTKKIDFLNVRLKTATGMDRVNTLNELCWEYRLMNNDKGLEYGKDALTLSEKLKFSNGSANAYVNLAYIYTHKGKTDLATDYYKKAIAIYDNMNISKKTKLGVAKIYEGLGLVYFQQKDYNTAVTYYNKALNVYQALAMHKNISVCYRIIGNIYEKAGDKDKANKHYFSELKNTIKSSDTNTLSSYLDFEQIDE
jgi:tetratricopeptide (TPR) repeat protein